MNRLIQLIIILIIISTLTNPHLFEIERAGNYRCGATVVDVWRYDPTGEACRVYSGQEIKSCYIVEEQHKNLECEQL